ncbi:uncharacterized protein CMC5_066540 [Chondromyces crocatus]|uniref:JmjC domain-containing protein n=2 Tax=Chondromyces crocatus TaxID=52 RepID=A0A0K1EP78_CHOCO|nr:uncharacterized protein CMC5_066540 [Chondromyces crocatus]
MLAELLSPLGIARFIEEHADRRPLHLPAGPAKRRRVQAFFDRGRFMRAIARGHAASRGGSEDGFSLRAIFPPAHEGPVEIPIAPNQVEALLAAGASVCVHDIHRADGALAALVSAAKHALSCVGQVGMSCYVSPAGHGLTTHFDAQAVLTLQVEGAKVWRYSEEPAIEVPRANAVLEASGKVEWTGTPPGDLPFPDVAPPAGKLREVELKPGDVLYLPAGHWHETLAGSPSMGLVLYFVPLSFSAFLERWLWSCFEENDAWIKGVPMSMTTTGEMMRGVPAPVAAYVTARLEELLAKLQTTDASEVQLARVWRRFIAQGSATVSAEPSGPVRRGALLRAVSPHLLSALDAREAQGGVGVYLCAGDREIALPPSLSPIVQEVLGGRPFRAGAAPGVPWAEARAALEVLLAEGVLERVDEVQASASESG